MSASSHNGLVHISEGEECPECGEPAERGGTGDFSRNLGDRFQIWVHARYRDRKVHYCVERLD